MIRNNFFELDISPNFRIADTAEIELLKQELIILQGNVKIKYMDEKNIKHEENMFIEQLDS